MKRFRRRLNYLEQSTDVHNRKKANKETGNKWYKKYKRFIIP